MARKNICKCKILKAASILCLNLLLYGCDILPGMRAPEISSMHLERVDKNIHVSPVVVPITPSLLINQKNSLYYYYVAPGDILSISVLQHPEFNPSQMTGISAVTTTAQGAAGQAGYLVNPTGHVYIPIIGYVHVGDKTVDQIRDAVTVRLKKYIPNPIVNVRVSDFRGKKVYVVGEVIKPNFIPINDIPLTIADALSMTGSIDQTSADPKHIYVIRGEITHPYIYWLDAKNADSLILAEHFYLYAGDILYVSSSATTRWNRIVNQILPTLSATYFVRSLSH